MKFNIAIDGTSGVGKSSIAKYIAKQYNMIHLDTGAMYRCVALYLGENATDIQNKLSMIQIQFENDQVFLNGENITTKIRTNEIAKLASEYAKLPIIRQFLVQKQQEIAKEKGYILDGRDIGSVVLPDAEIKLFLSADPKVRAQRRTLELQQLGQVVDIEKVYHEIVQRDINDQTREISPLIKVEDAYEIDTSNKTLEEVVEEVSDYIQRRLLK